MILSPFWIQKDGFFRFFWWVFDFSRTRIGFEWVGCKNIFSPRSRSLQGAEWRLRVSEVLSRRDHFFSVFRSFTHIHAFVLARMAECTTDRYFEFSGFKPTAALRRCIFRTITRTTSKNQGLVIKIEQQSPFTKSIIHNTIILHNVVAISVIRFLILSIVCFGGGFLVHPNTDGTSQRFHQHNE